MERDYSDLAGHQTLIVEDDHSLAMDTAEAVRRSGGVVLGPVPDADGAMDILASSQVDAAVLDIRLGEKISFLIAMALREKGVRVVFISGDDDWYLSNDLDDVPTYRKPGDPDNVVRILFEPRHDEES